MKSANRIKREKDFKKFMQELERISLKYKFVISGCEKDRTTVYELDEAWDESKLIYGEYEYEIADS
ncbi:MAG: hypothetical protein FWC41_00205 [Firmicutes bacterium]|nr:hypothetical protein [Bacillota bacterium]